MNKALTQASKITLFIIAAFVILCEVRVIEGATRGEEPFFIPVIAIFTVLIGIIGQMITPSYWSAILATGLSLFAAMSVYIEVIFRHGFSIEFLGYWFILITGTFTAHLALLLLTAYFSLKIRHLFSSAKP